MLYRHNFHDYTSMLNHDAAVAMIVVVKRLIEHVPVDQNFPNNVEEARTLLENFHRGSMAPTEDRQTNPYVEITNPYWYPGSRAKIQGKFSTAVCETLIKHQFGSDEYFLYDHTTGEVFKTGEQIPSSKTYYWCPDIKDGPIEELPDTPPFQRPAKLAALILSLIHI